MAVKLLSLDTARNVEISMPEKVDPDRPLYLLAHGSNNDMNSPFLSTISEHLQSKNVNVVRFNFPYKVAGKNRPDRSEILENSWKLAIDWVGDNIDFNGLYIGGKGMGARIATMIARDVPQIKGMIFLGYTLHAPGKFDEVRDEYLIPLRIPMLFIQGTRDPFARMDLLQSTLSDLREWITLHWIEGGDHSFRILVRQGKSYPETLEHVSSLISGWIDEVQKKE